MTEKPTFESLAADIRSRMDALKDGVTDAQVREILATELPTLLEDAATTRKFGFDAPEKVQYTKYARAGLNDADVRFLHTVLATAKDEPTVRTSGPSEMLTNAVRAMDTLTTTEGLELIGQQFVTDLWEAARRESRVFGLIDTFAMSAPSAYLPVEVDIPEPIFVAENTSSTASDYATQETHSQRVLVEAKKLLLHQVWSHEMEEDSLIPFIPFLRRQAALSIAHYNDAIILNGDTTNAATGNINLDDADPANDKYYLAFDGIRHAALVDNTANAVDNGNGAPTLAQIVRLKGLMRDNANLVDWGHPTDGSDLVIVCDPATGDALTQLDEVVTVDKYGSQATVLTGELGRLAGVPIVTSMAVSLTEADGKVSTTAANNTRGQLVMFNRRGFKAGWRRQVQVETERLPGRDQTRLVYSWRLGFGRFTPSGAASGIESVAVLYNIAV